MPKFSYAVAIGLLMLSCASNKPKVPLQGIQFPPSMQATYIYTEGIKASLMTEDGTYPASLFSRVLAIDSTHAPSYYELAALYATYDTDRAISYIEKACKLDSTNVWYRNLMGRLMVFKGEFDKALDIYSNLTRMAPHNPENYRMLAALYEENKQPFTAISILDSAQYKLGRIEELADMKRNLLVGLGLFDKAIAESKALISEYPWNDDNYRILGTLYSRTGRDSLAGNALREAVKLNPANIENLSVLSNFYRSKGDISNYFVIMRQMVNSDQMTVEGKIAFINEMKGNRAFYTDNFFQIKDLISVLMIKYPDNYSVVNLHGESIIAASGVEQGLSFYKSQLKNPDVPVDIYNVILEIEAYLNHPDSLAKYTQLTIDRFSASTDLYVRLGGALSYIKRDNEALDAYKNALRYAKSDSVRSVVTGIIGDHYHKIGNKKKCFRYYERALRFSQTNAMVLNNFSYYLTTDGPEGREIDRAIDMAKRATTLETGNATYLDTYAWALYRAGRFAEAKKVMQSAIALDTSKSEVLFVHYGDILYELKEYFMASVYWRKALEKGYDADEISSRMKKIEGK